MQRSIALLLALAAALLTGCQSLRREVIQNSTPAAPSAIVQFTDITAAAGIKFIHNTGAFGQNLIPETMGSGAAFIDYDGDGYQDLLLVNDRDWTSRELARSKISNRQLSKQFSVTQRPSTCALYHNNGNGTFTDVTHQAGLDVPMYGMGVAVGDYDNDGKPDLYITALGRNYLFHNETTAAGVRFRDVTRAAGVEDAGWSTSAAWVDYNRDGKLDLFVCHYIQWTPATDIHTTAAGETKSYVGPLPYKGQTNRLYRNLGNGKFEDVSRQAGITRRLSRDTKLASPLIGKALGVALCNFNNSGWPDLLVTNDGLPNFLFRNNKNGTFTEVGVEMNIAYNEAGKTRAGMGVDAADIDNSGRETVIIGNFSQERLGLYQNRGGFFTDIAPHITLGQDSLNFLTFGCAFADYDNDGWLDLFAANGHVDPDIEKNHPEITYAERPFVFHNEGKGQFKEVGLLSGSALAKPIVARGVACADLDLDGDVDVLFTTNGGAPLLLRNDGGNKNNALRLILEGTQSNRSAIGASLEAKVGAQTLHRMVRSGSSYLSQSELPITLGLGHETHAQRLTIHWPSSRVTNFNHIQANQIIWINESKGITKRQTIKH